MLSVFLICLNVATESSTSWLWPIAKRKMRWGLDGWSCCKRGLVSGSERAERHNQKPGERKGGLVSGSERAERHNQKP